ncbi:head maturation protease, ClpP-related [Devosia sp. SD17-2]|uniref:head maturation protease, ClpP-related n=1 Tax=Devosia sp. SD17-2 TaxID=2976459 RepID=UPI0023D85291|nr:head maturation protease, ClpP-related [Devosia sp. SD17-2]WEJ33872.1 Clp protease ClpP [Devosia sp. SD17-2]
MAAILDDGKLRLSGYVGDYYYDDGFTASDVVMALAQLDDDAALDVHINSGGGIATEGAAIHALLTARTGTTNVIVEGVAASAASLIAMAGKTVTMSAGAVMMIHDPSGITWGTSAEHAKTMAALDTLATAYSRVYAAKSGKTAEDCRAIMKAERWMTPEEAVSEGFADATTETVSEPVAAFDYRTYARAPQALTALATQKNWSAPTMKAAPAASPRPAPENTMSDKTDGGSKPVDAKQITADAKTRIKAIMTSAEAAGREEQAEYLAYDTEMSAADAVAILAKAPKPTAAADPDPSPGPGPVDDSATLEARRLNGEGLNGKPATAQRSAPTLMVDNMRKLLGKGAA